MTIDEAIAHEREVAERNRILADSFDIKICVKCAEEHEQLAEWLEELKAIKDGGIPIIHGKSELELHDKAIRNKAIDDYMNKLCNHCMQQTNECYKLECPFCTDCCDIVNIAEKIKAGVENEQSI